MRQANAVDFWRGVALVMIFIDHVPGNVFASFTLHNWAISDAAELFVFLAGWSLSYATGGPFTPEPASRTFIRLVSRAIELYRAQLVITVLALAFLAATALIRANPIYLEWHNAGPAFFDPVRATIGSVLLTYQLSYFNILPLYIVLLLMAPVFIVIGRRSPVVALTLSLGLYGAALVFRIEMPNWPSEEPWFFNPLAWQLLLVLGFLSAEQARANARAKIIARRMMPLAVLVLIVGGGATLLAYSPDPMSVPEPRFLFRFDKTYLSPARLVSLLAVVLAFQSVYRHIGPRLGHFTDLLCSLGRNSLAVFCVASLLSLVGQIVRFVNEGSLLVDVAIVLCGIGLMGFTAWFVEWRSRSPR